jgi:hypothetical protein
MKPQDFVLVDSGRRSQLVLNTVNSHCKLPSKASIPGKVQMIRGSPLEADSLICNGLL